ncbi:MAG: serine/threonine protein kinase [Pyrinomonadaceae bacterium]|nr:serine/threonine protein kinase [Pyrinomonadaceae bacterium]
MRSNDWQKVEELLDAALDLAPDARARFLDELSATKPDLRREVESLLVCEEKVDGFLATPALALSSDFFEDAEAVEERAGQTVGHYRIIREIGRGGMGAVFLAERSDGEFQQEVALKVVRRSFADSELARRFRRERQILASLNHPNIARLLDGGVSTDGEPYFAMEHVEGVRIDDYCAAENLRTEERLKLFLAVSRGVAYAHQHLVVHRDIKPSNILVTADGTPKLLDFGIAKLLDDEGTNEHTRTELRAFTPVYASPEQARGERVTTASDVYSLGVLLQHMLGNGHRSETPGQQTSVANVPTDQEQGSKRNRHRQRFLSAELANIIAMARREEPARRYASVAQFAEDVQNYLDGLPTRAQKDSFTYRAGKFIRRNRLTVGAAALVALALVVGLAVALWQANAARRERDRAERRFNDVRQLSNALLSDIAPKIERLPGSTDARQAVLTQSLKYLDSLANEAAGDLQLQSELASAYEKVGDLQGNPTNPNLIALADALASYEKANAMRRNLLERNPRDFERRRMMANNYRALGDIRWQTNEPAESLNNSQAALGLYSELLAEHPGSTDLRLSVARTTLDIGKVHSTNEKYAEAISFFQKVVAMLGEQLGLADVESLLLLAEARKQLGNSLSWEGKQKEAEEEMARAVALSEALFAANPFDNRMLTALHQTYMLTSSVYEDVNDTLSNEYAFKALKIIEATVAKDPANIRARQQLGKTYSRLGVTLDNTGKPDQSVLYLEKAVNISRELIGAETKNRRLKYDLATSYIRLGDARKRQRNFRDSITDLERAASVLKELTDADASDNASLRNLANAIESQAKSYEGLAALATGAEKSAQRQMAKQSYQRAYDILQQLEAKNALSKVDRKSMEKLRVILEKYE